MVDILPRVPTLFWSDYKEGLRLHTRLLLGMLGALVYVHADGVITNASASPVSNQQQQHCASTGAAFLLGTDRHLHLQRGGRETAPDTNGLDGIREFLPRSGWRFRNTH